MPHNVARIALNLSLDRFFDYRIPEHLLGKVRTGSKVNIPFGNGLALRSGYVMEISDRSEFPDLRAIDSICANSPEIPDPLLKLAEWMALYYCCPRELAVRNLLPGAVRSGKIKPRTRPHCRLGDTAKAAEYIEKNARAKARVALLKTLMLEHELPQDILLLKAGAGKGALDALVKEGIVDREEIVDDRDPFKGASVIPTKPLTPTPEQAEALKIIFDTMEGRTGKHVVLLHGVTCSGKTEVYLQAIAKALEQGGEAIVLVPEISLTPQTVERFRARFGDMVSVLHSGLSEGERHDEWMKVHSGRVRIAVGARSALFAPFTKLKLIVVDEEHEQSYKQSEAPRYNARDVAVMRGKLEGATVILGSATPSLESHYNAAVAGKYAHARMLKRSDPRIVLPDVRIIDMRCEETDDGLRPVLSKELIRGVRERISVGEQSIIFLNRRGFAKQMICEDCGFVARCPDCSAAYTYHRKMQILTCHLCGAMVSAYEKCPQCGSEKIRYSGAGTEKVENMAFAVFKDARIARMDSDSMTRPSLYEEILGKFRRGEIDILIGTQMIAKGLDFPNVTFVGVVNADMGLFLPDFRAAERTFQLLTQVAGRAGRGEHRGEVLIQTSNPFNSAITAAANHDCDTFYADELPVREELKFPPYGHVIALHFDGEDPQKIEAYAAQLMERIQPYLDPETEVTEPMPAPIERIKGKFRYMATFRAGKLGRLKQVLRYETCRNQPRGLQVYLDIDPVSML